MCDCQTHRCFEMMEMVTSAAQVNFQDNTRIRQNKVTSIMVQSPDPAESLAFLSPMGRTLANWAVLNSSYLYIVTQNGTTLAPIPLSMIVRNYNSPEPLAVSWELVDPVQSYVKINTGASGYAATEAFVFVFGIDCDACGISPNMNKL